MPSLSNQIVAYLAIEYPAWTHSGQIERLAMENQYKASNAGRRARELVTAGRIEVRYNPKHEAEYRWLPQGTLRTSSNAIASKFLKDFAPKEDVDKELTLF